MESYFVYLIFFAVTLFIGGLFCMGLWYSSQGGDSIRPDGKEVNDWGMIFYPIHRFLERSEPQYVFYKGDQLDEFIETLKCDYKQYSDLIADITKTELGFTTSTNEYAKTWEVVFCNLYKTKQIIYSRNETEFQFFKVYDIPKINQYISKPLLLCYKCYASFWGTILFWTMTAFAVKTNFIQKDFSILIPMWIIYCFSLVVVNIFIEKKTR